MTLHRTLLDLRKTYLSLTASPTAVSQIDDEANAMMREVAGKLREFEEAEAIRVGLAKEKRRREARWKVWKLPEDGEDGAESGEEKIVREFREAVIWMLKERLERVSEVVRGMREKRVSRAVGRLESSPFAGASIHPIAPIPERPPTTNTTRNGGTSWNSLTEGVGLEEGEASGEMMQMFEEENREMLKGFEGMMEGVRFEIPAFQTTLSNTLQECRKVPNRDFRASASSILFSQRAVRAYRPTCKRFLGHNGESGARKQTAEGGSKETFCSSLLFLGCRMFLDDNGDLGLLHIAWFEQHFNVNL